MNILDISVFPKGSENESFAQYFIGQSYLNMLSTEQVVIGGGKLQDRMVRDRFR